MKITPNALALVATSIPVHANGARNGKGSRSHPPWDGPIECKVNIDSSTPSRGNDCRPGSGTWICNDYAAADNTYEYGFGISGVLKGAEVFSGIPELPSGAGDLPGDKLQKLDYDRSAGGFPDVNKEGDRAFIKALQSLTDADDLIFGDLKYYNPGWGGVNNYDIFEVKPGKTITLKSFKRVHVKKDDVTQICDINGLKPGNEDPTCKLNGNEKANVWWSWGPDSEGLTVFESLDQVSQVCQTNGEGLEPSKQFGFDQGLKCTYGPGTPIMVGLGSWRNTKGVLQEISEDGDAMICDESNPHGWANPQKVVKPDVYQYLIANGLDAFGDPRDENIKQMACSVCNLKLEDAAASFDDDSCVELSI